MPLVEECPFFNINFDSIPEPYQSSGYGLGFEDAAENLELALSGSGYNGNNLPGFLQEAIDISAILKNTVSGYGSNTCTINTNFEEVKKAQYYSFVAFLRNKFERYRQLCNYQIDGRWGNQPCKLIELKYEFSFLNNTFQFTINQVSDAELIDSEKIEEAFDVSTFSGSIYYKFYVKPEVVTELPEGLIDKINYLYDKTREIADKTEE